MIVNWKTSPVCGALICALLAAPLAIAGAKQHHAKPQHPVSSNTVPTPPAPVAAQPDPKNVCKNGKAEEAIAACTSLIDGGKLAGAELAEVAVWRARAYVFVGQYAKAKLDFDQVAFLRPDWAQGYMERGFANMMGGKAAETHDNPEVASRAFDDAISCFSKAANLEPNNAEAHYNHGLACYAIAKYAHSRGAYYDCARDAAGQAIALNPDYADAYRLRGDARFLSDGRGAIADYTEALRISPDDLQTLAARAFAYEVTHQEELALQDYTQITKAEPNKTFGFNSRGYIYYQRDEYARAIQEFDQAIKLDPKNAFAYKYRGKAKKELGDKAGGNADIQTAESINPDI